MLGAVAAVWREGGWPAEVSRDGIVAPYNAPGTGPPPWQVYRVAAHTVFGVATAVPYGATRWRFLATKPARPRSPARRRAPGLAPGGPWGWGPPGGHRRGSGVSPARRRRKAPAR